jgi:hypothetical protein
LTCELGFSDLVTILLLLGQSRTFNKAGYNTLVSCMTHYTTLGNGASWLGHLSTNSDGGYRH